MRRPQCRSLDPDQIPTRLPAPADPCDSCACVAPAAAAVPAAPPPAVFSAALLRTMWPNFVLIAPQVPFDIGFPEAAKAKEGLDSADWLVRLSCAPRLLLRHALLQALSLIVHYVSQQVDGIFAVDIVLNFFTAYLGKSGSIITDQNSITQRYLYGWCVLSAARASPPPPCCRSGLSSSVIGACLVCTMPLRMSNCRCAKRRSRGWHIICGILL